MHHIFATSLHANLTKISISPSIMPKGNFIMVSVGPSPWVSSIVLVIPLAWGKLLISILWVVRGSQERFKVDEKVGLSSATVTISSGVGR